jgi:hypothetical protein
MADPRRHLPAKLRKRSDTMTTNDSTQLDQPVRDLTREELDEIERECREWTYGYMQASEDEWTRKGLAFHWLDTEPTYVSPIDWDMFIPDPSAPCRRIFRFTLIGGGQIAAVEHWHRATWGGGGEPPFEPRLSDYPGPSFVVTAHVGDHVGRYRGHLGGPVAEMQAKAVLFRNAPQAVIERVAATLQAIDCNRDHFFALLDGATSCAICGRPLRDEISKLVGVGPNCAHALGIPHSKEAAGKRLQLRRQLLGETRA